IGVGLLMWGTRVRDHDSESQMANLHDRAAASEERSRELEKGNLALRQNVERERTERLKLEAAIAPRTISQDEKKALVAAWKRFAGKRVRAESYVSDVESTVLGQQIVEALSEADLVVTPAIATKMPINFIAFGIHVTAVTEADRPVAH